MAYKTAQGFNGCLLSTHNFFFFFFRMITDRRTDKKKPERKRRKRLKNLTMEMPPRHHWSNIIADPATLQNSTMLERLKIGTK